MLSRTLATEATGVAFRGAAPLEHDDYAVVSVGDHPKTVDALLELVLAGTKRGPGGPRGVRHA
jgi:hypothetical protein